MIKTIAFIILIYLLVKFISRFFLPGGKKKTINARVFYRVFKNIREQKKRHEQQQKNRSNPNSKFDNVEEAEFEEVEEAEAETEANSKSTSDSSSL